MSTVSIDLSNEPQIEISLPYGGKIRGGLFDALDTLVAMDREWASVKQSIPQAYQVCLCERMRQHYGLSDKQLPSTMAVLVYEHIVEAVQTYKKKLAVSGSIELTPESPMNTESTPGA